MSERNEHRTPHGYRAKTGSVDGPCAHCSRAEANQVHAMTDPTEVEKVREEWEAFLAMWAPAQASKQGRESAGRVAKSTKRLSEILIAAERRDAKSDGHVAMCQCEAAEYVDETLYPETIDPRCIEWREKA